MEKLRVITCYSIAEVEKKVRKFGEDHSLLEVKVVR